MGVKSVLAQDSFQVQNKAILMVAACSGLYMPSIKHLLPNQRLALLFQWFSLFPLASASYNLASTFINSFLTNDHTLLHFLNITRRASMFSGLLFKALFCWVHRKDFEKFFTIWNESFKGDMFEDERQEKLKNSTRSTKIVAAFLYTGMVTAVAFYVLPILMAHRDIASPVKMSSMSYKLAFELLQLFMVVVSGAAVDIILLSVLAFTVVQLKHLQTSLGHIVNQVRVNQDGALVIVPALAGCQLENTTVEEKFSKVELDLQNWIKQHQEVIRMCDSLKTLLNPVLSSQAATTVLYVTVVLIQAVKYNISTLALAGMALYCFCYISCIMTLAWYGDNISRRGAGIFDEAFGCAWFIYPKNMKSTFQIIIMRSQQPLGLKMWYIYWYQPRSFVKISSTIYNGFAFLLHVLR